MVNDTAEIQALVVCGASGTGKTVTSWEIGRTLQNRGIRHALIDTDELDRVWPQPEPVEALISVSRRNLQAIWATFSDLGVRRLVLSGVMASIPQSRSWLEEAISGATFTFVRLTADRGTREQRLRDREVGSGFEGEMRASDQAVAIIRKREQSGTPVVVTDGKEVSAVAEEVLRTVGWR
jgi:predicted kinase